MHIEYPSPGKINLTLRVVGKRDDGNHRLVSVFRKLPGLERIAVDLSQDNRVRMLGTQIRGVNLVEKVISFLKKNNDFIPSVSVSIHKSIPPGTGLGAGTGNAAAIYGFFKDFCDLKTVPEDLKPLGSDLPFLASHQETALVRGVGDLLKPLPSPSFSVLLAVPRWRSSTVSAYGKLDSFFSCQWPVSEDDALIEAQSVLSKLNDGLDVGLLPNDFLPPLLCSYPDYQKLFSTCEESKALAWGLSGSGSSAFALYRKFQMPMGILDSLSNLDFIEKLIVLE